MQSGHPARSSRAVVKGAAWAAIDNWVQQGVGLISFVVIGSLVGPRLYGVMALGMTYHLVLASVLRDTFGEALIQRQTLERAHYDTVFWTLVGLGTALMLLSFALGAPVAGLFREPDLRPVIWALGLTFPLLGAGNFYRSLLRREFNFKALALRSIFAYGLSAVIAITLAVKGFGIWSLVIYQLLLHALDLLALAVQSRWRPQLRFSRRHYGELADFSYKTMGNYGLANIGTQIDRFLLGYFIGAGPLGLYSMARRIVEGIDQTAMGVINAIALPTFARVQHDHAELRRMLYGMTHFSMIIAGPVYAGLGLVAPKLIAVVLPDEWRPTAPLLSILCYSGVFFPAVIFLSSCQRAIGQAGLLLALALTSMTLRVVFCLVAAFAGYGVNGIVLAIAVSTLAMVPIRIYFARCAIGVTVPAYLASLASPLAATLIMLAIGYGLEDLLSPHWPDVFVLGAMVATGVVSYVGALCLISPGSISQIRAVLKRKPAGPAAIDGGSSGVMMPNQGLED